MMSKGQGHGMTRYIRTGKLAIRQKTNEIWFSGHSSIRSCT